MEGLGEKKPWGKLSRLLGAETEAASELLLCKREWTIGRKKGNSVTYTTQGSFHERYQLVSFIAIGLGLLVIS